MSQFLDTHHIDLAPAIWSSLDRHRKVWVQFGPDPQMIGYFDTVRRGAVTT